MSSYDTAAMHSTAGTIKTNAHDLQTSINTLWSSYQNALDGTLPALNTCLASFMNTSKPALTVLAQNRTDIGTKLDQAATAVEHEENSHKTRFARIMMQ